MKPPVLLIINPIARHASERNIRKAVDILRSTGVEVRLFLTGKRGDAEEEAREAARNDLPLIIAAGGDGTINEVLNGIVYSKTALAILPMGTTNVLAKELGVPEKVEGAISVALNGAVHKACVGKIVLLHPSPVSRYFCLMAGVGFDGEAVYRFDHSLKKLSGKGAYVLSGLKTLMSYSPGPLAITLDGETLAGYSAVIGKASKYGGNFKVTPDASLLNPDFYACILQGRRRSDVLRYLAGILTGKHTGFRDVLYRKVSSVEIEGDARIQVDGDYVGKTPAIITAEPYALRLIF